MLELLVSFIQHSCVVFLVVLSKFLRCIAVTSCCSTVHLFGLMKLKFPLPPPPTKEENPYFSYHIFLLQITRTQPSTPGIRRKLDSDVLHKPIWRHSVKADSFKDLLGKNHHLPPTHSTKLFRNKKCSTSENTSPNIQV